MADHTHSSYDVHDVASEHHQHYDLENLVSGLREDLNSLRYEVAQLQDELAEVRRGVQ